jgi:chemotaxis protein methyltransferase CheR
VSNVAARSSGSIRLDGPVPEPTDGDFDSLRALILKHAGIHLNESKKALVYGRLARRVRELGLATFGEYHRRVTEDDEELVELLDRITTNETHFFREPHHFEYLERVVVPGLVADADAGLRARHVRVWSAGCSTGEEPYSVAMTLLERLPPSAGWSIDIVATDLSTRVLDVAHGATWPIARAGEIPEALLKRHMLRGIGARAGLLRASPQLRAMVRVERLNLNEDEFPAGPFDVVLCRNVLIYFHPVRRLQVLERLLDTLAPCGLLFVGHAESVHGLAARAQCVSPTIYQRRVEDTYPVRLAGGFR